MRERCSCSLMYNPPSGIAVTASMIHVSKLLAEFVPHRLVLSAWTVYASFAAAQQVPAPAQSGLGPLIQQAVAYQLEDYHHSTWALRYRVHRVDGKEDTVRDLVESANGNVGRTIARQGQPLTPEQDALEQQRLRSLTPAEMKHHSHGSENSDKYGLDLMRAMPSAMTYTLAPGQPQLPQFPTQQIVLDYTPNPQFHPANTAESLLTGVAGRLWLDARTHHLLRLELNITRNLNLALGLIARVYQGGTMVYEQRPVGGGHDAYSHIEINVTLRELMVKTVPYHSTLDTSEMTLLPSPPSLQDAVTMLLSGQAGHHE